MHTILIRVVHQHGNSVTKNGWNMKAVLSVKGFYCGIYCTGSCRFYFFSIIAVRGGSHNAVWSADTDHPLREDALLQLTRDKGLALRRSDGTTVWSATNTTGTPVVGMNLTEAGNLVLFDSQSTAVWQSFDHPVDALLVGWRLYKGVFLVFFRQMRTTRDRILAFIYLKMLQKKAEEDRVIDIVEDKDEDMENNTEQVVKMIRIGAWCLQNDPTERPFMPMVVKVLEGVMEAQHNIGTPLRFHRCLLDSRPFFISPLNYQNHLPQGVKFQRSRSQNRLINKREWMKKGNLNGFMHIREHNK